MTSIQIDCDLKQVLNQINWHISIRFNDAFRVRMNCEEIESQIAQTTVEMAYQY
jgi:hypothetical protein